VKICVICVQKTLLRQPLCAKNSDTSPNRKSYWTITNFNFILQISNLKNEVSYFEMPMKHPDLSVDTIALNLFRFSIVAKKIYLCVFVVLRLCVCLQKTNSKNISI